jgi:hypothetical protein
LESRQGETLPEPRTGYRAREWINGENGQNTFDFDINSCSFEQFRIPDGNYGIMQLQVTAHDSLGQWYGYGSSVDEVTANNWSSVLR